MNIGFPIFLFFISLVNGQQKMMKIFGKVLGADLNDGVSKPNDVCVEDCFQKSDCILVFMNSEEQCLPFDFNSTEQLTVVETAKTDELFVAFKTQFLLNQCPAYESMDLSITVGEESIPWIKNGNEYTFKKCVGDWKMFKREKNVTVCMQTFEIKTTNFEAAKQVCEEKGPYKLAGLQTEEELNWVYDRQDPSSDERFYGFWIGAKRQAAFSGKDEPYFDFPDGYTDLNEDLYENHCYCSGNQNSTPEDCLIVCEAHNGLKMNDDNCESTELGLGVVCGYQLL